MCNYLLTYVYLSQETLVSITPRKDIHKSFILISILLFV